MSSGISIRILIETFQEFCNHQQDNFNNCLTDKTLSTYWKNSSQKRQIVVESSKEFSSKLQMASPIDSDSNWKQKEIDYQCYNFEPTYLPTTYLKVSTTYQLFQTVNQSSAVRHDFNLRYRLFSSFKVRKIK